jgi:hypothetical protein
MTLHHHHHSSLQKNLWCNSAQPLKFSFKYASLQTPLWYGSLSQAGFVSAAAATTYHPIWGITLVDVIGVVGGGGWGRGPYSRRWHSFGVDGLLLVHLLFFFIGVGEDDDLIIAGQPRKSRLRSSKSLLANSSSCEVSAMRLSSLEDEERSTTGVFPKDPLAQTPVSVDSVRRPLVGTSVAAVIQRVLVVEY